MPYDPSTRVLSLSFTRDPGEHADVMLETGRRMMTSTDPASAWTAFGIAVGFGVVVGVVMELHRRFLLPLLLGPTEIAPLSTVALQLLPLVLLFAVLYVLLYRRAAQRRRGALVARLQPNLFIDVDIFAQGMVSASGGFRVEIDWPIVRNIVIEDNRLEIECESFAVYIPERAFAKRAAFNEAAREIRDLWRDAVKRARDVKAVAAGLE